uniref:Uncharacterized protein n=1 Tax=Oryza glumipatula TaxID=40148 RepID=A0A0D9ZIN3_9ORYZ
MVFSQLGRPISLSTLLLTTSREQAWAASLVSIPSPAEMKTMIIFITKPRSSLSLLRSILNSSCRTNFLLTPSNGNTAAPSSSWSALWSAAASASSTSGHPRPSRSKPPRHQLLLAVLFKTPQEPRRMEHRGGRSTSSSPTSAAGVNL